MQLIQELNKNYQEKLIAEAMQQKQKKKEKMKREEFMRKATDIWLHDIIPNFSTRVEEKRTRKMWRQGLPPRVRGQIWQLAVGNSLQVNLDLFNILLKKKAPQLDVRKFTFVNNFRKMWKLLTICTVLIKLTEMLVIST
jgi:hypothetical protein